MEEKLLPYNMLPTTTNKNGSITIEPRCNSITLINYGSSTVVINGVLTLYPGTPGTNSGESISYGGNRAELFKGNIDVAFSSTVLANNRLLIIQKVYV